MEIGAAYQSNGLWNLDPLAAVSQENNSASSNAGSRSAGDTAEISDEARRLFSEMIHRYDRPTTSVQADTGGSSNQADAEAAESGDNAGSGGSGGSGGASASGNDAESIRKQIQSLKSQLMAMTSQLAGSAADAGISSKMDALQSQIAALEAQLNEMEQSG